MAPVDESLLCVVERLGFPNPSRRGSDARPLHLGQRRSGLCRWIVAGRRLIPNFWNTGFDNSSAVRREESLGGAVDRRNALRRECLTTEFPERDRSCGVSRQILRLQTAAQAGGLG